MNDRGFASFYVLGITAALSILVISITTIFYSGMLSEKEVLQDIQLEMDAYSATERSIEKLKINGSYTDADTYNDLGLSVKMRSTVLTSDITPLTLTLNQPKHRVYSFPVYSDDDVTFRFEGLPPNTTVTVSNGSTVNEVFMNDNALIEGDTFYQSGTIYSDHNYGLYTLDIETTDIALDLSSVTISVGSYTKTSEVEMTVETIGGKQLYQRVLNVTNTLTGVNLVN